MLFRSHMAERRPLVVIAGVIQQLPVGDTLPAQSAINQWLLDTNLTLSNGECYVVGDKLEIADGVVLTIDNESIMDVV